jgi:hypothetical protein
MNMRFERMITKSGGHATLECNEVLSGKKGREATRRKSNFNAKFN